jgi:hypothetical protein
MPKWLLALWSLLLVPAAAAADNAHLELLEVSLDGPRVLASFRLEGAFDQEVRERLESGLGVGFTYQFRLLRDRRRWWDKRLDRNELEVTASYDAVTHEYLVNLKQDDKLIDSHSVRSAEEVEVAMTRFERFPVFLLEDVNPEARLQVKVRADLGPGTFLAFIPTRITTDWVTSAKFRPPPAATAP